MIRMSTAVAGSVWTRQVGLKGIFQFWINILHVYLMTLVQKKPKTSRDFFLVQVPKTLRSEDHSDYIFDIPAISLGEILGSLGLGNNIDLSLGGRGAETSKDFFFGCALFTPSLCFMEDL